MCYYKTTRSTLGVSAYSGCIPGSDVFVPTFTDENKVSALVYRKVMEGQDDPGLLRPSDVPGTLAVYRVRPRVPH